MKQRSSMATECGKWSYVHISLYGYGLTWICIPISKWFIIHGDKPYNPIYNRIYSINLAVFFDLVESFRRKETWGWRTTPGRWGNGLLPLAEGFLSHGRGYQIIHFLFGISHEVLMGFNMDGLWKIHHIPIINHHLWKPSFMENHPYPHLWKPSVSICVKRCCFCSHWISSMFWTMPTKVGWG